ncbi:exonuclease 1 [Lepeophtheirus salmonis]|uniref:exonuclease 1 n=1 Tax=Lepeophtheirus salmonis TaxID=72036 RepID=UPI001AE5C43F|nr:exonuclease 1-like [Lepeophtheirus salmonis]
MGITGLIPFLKNATRDANIREFSGKTAVIDVYGWLHRGTFGCADRLIKGEETDGYIRYVMKFVQIFLSANIRPILVFDGRNLPSKSLTESKRRERRELNKRLGSEYLRDGRNKEAIDCFRKAIDITPEMAHAAIREARRQGVDVLVAPYEADAQMAYLVEIGVADFVVSEDSDLVVFGCEKIFFKLDMNGFGKLYEKQFLSKCFGGATNISFEKFRYISIMSGCDYLPSLHGIGLAKSLRFWKSVNNPDIASVLPKIPSYLRMPQLEVTTDYIAGFMRANETFLYQLVYDPIKKELRHLSSPPDPSIERPFAGQFLDAELAYQMAVGNVNLHSLKLIDKYDPTNPIKVHSMYKSIWSNQPMRSGIKLDENLPPKNGSQLLMSTAFAGAQSKKRKIISGESPSSLIKREKMEPLEKNDSELKESYTKIIQTSPIISPTSTSRRNESFIVSKYFAIDTKDRCKDRKYEKGRKDGGQWLDSINSVVTHEDKFIYTTEERKSLAIKVESPKVNQDSSSDKKRNPFVKLTTSKSSPSSPLLNIVSPKAVKVECTPDKKYGSLLSINEKDCVPKRLFNDDDNAPTTLVDSKLKCFPSNEGCSEETKTESSSPFLVIENGDKLLTDLNQDAEVEFDETLESPKISDTPTHLKATKKLKSLSSGTSASSSYFKKVGSKPSGLMKSKKSPSQQKSILEFWSKK